MPSAWAPASVLELRMGVEKRLHSSAGPLRFGRSRVLSLTPPCLRVVLSFLERFAGLRGRHTPLWSGRLSRSPSSSLGCAKSKTVSMSLPAGPALWLEAPSRWASCPPSLGSGRFPGARCPSWVLLGQVTVSCIVRSPWGPF